MNEIPWRPLSDPPPEGRRFWVRLKNGMECYATRIGNAIHVGVPDSFHPEAVAWREDPEAPE